MTKITRAVTVADLAESLTSASLAIVAWNRNGSVAAEPAAFRFVNGRYFLGLPPAILTDGGEVAALIDDGSLYFDLRGVRVRGRISASQEARGDGLEWFELKPEREVAWHYGALRER